MGYFIIDFAAVDKIEELHHDKGIEDEGEMSGVDAIFFEGSLVVRLPSDGDNSS